MTTGMRAILFFLFFIAGSAFVLAIRVLNLVFGKAGKLALRAQTVRNASPSDPVD